MCVDEGRALVTLDMGFSDIRRYPPRETAGIVVLRPARQDAQHVAMMIKRVIPQFSTEELVGRLWIVNETTIRIRG